MLVVEAIPQITPNPEMSNVLEVLRCMSDQALIDLYENHLPFRLYIEHKCGASVGELASHSGLSAEWVQERIEAMRLCLEKQVYFRLGPLTPDPAFNAQLVAA